MSFNYQRGHALVDTGLLRDHVSKLREEKKTATRIYNNIRMLRNCSDSSETGKYYSIINDIEQLIEYLDRMIKVLSDAEDNAIELSRTIGALIEDDTYNTKSITSNAIML